MGLGLLLVLGGIFFSKFSENLSGDKVEVLGESATDDSLIKKEIVVEISGEVVNPGVYKLEEGSRVNDLLVASGGLSGDADRTWVDKNINKASKLIDGQKLYIPTEKETNSVQSGGQDNSSGLVLSGSINVNTADQKTLESLNGIGPEYAKKIIAHRYYSIVEEIVSKAGVPQKTFEKIKSQISVY